ncbi:MAG TPA: hypothetical protein PJ982_03010 [Lacipirellulaceae bacterium]|nr:hypothetical protein [Lacipirellulaceae bacterium]
MISDSAPTRVQAGATCVVVATLLCCASCARSPWNPFASAGPPAPDVLTTGSSLPQLIAAVNQNAQRIVTYQTHNASITIPGAMGVPMLKGSITAMRPGRVRFVASTALTGPEVDLGSNDELFWFWVKRNEPPAVYFARHAERPGSAAGQFMPIEPQWLLDALGMAEFRASDRHDGPLPGRDKNTIEVTSTVASPSGLMTKRTVVHATKALVIEQHLYDSQGTLLATAIARSHRFYPETGAALPEVVDIRIPPAELSMTINVGTVELNRLTDNPAMWTMPVIAGTPAIDLGAAPPGMPGGATPTLGSQISDANWYGPGPSTSSPWDVGPPPPSTIAAPGGVPIQGSPPAVAATQFVPPGGVVARLTPPATADAGPRQTLPPGGVVPPALTR